MVEPKEGSFHKKGFTLTELLIVVAIIAIIAAISFATYMSFLKKAKAIEALVTLDYVAELETAYYVENGIYTDDLNLLGFSTKDPLKYYTITITVPAGPNPNSFDVTISGNIDSDPDLDVWTIDEDKNIVHATID